MFHYLRHLRKKLMEQNKVRTYLLYAIGEILLVVIGILLALQINNWNEANKAQKLEISTLLELSNGLEKDRNILAGEVSYHEIDLAAILHLETLLTDKNQLYNSEMDTLFGKVYGIRYKRLNTAFYEDLKSSGLQVIRNQDIRRDIVNLFENDYETIEGIQENETSVNQVNRPYYLENFSALNFRKSATPNDFDHIWNDPYYKNIVHYRAITLERNQINNYKDAIHEIDAVLLQIKEYLN